jgi:hypothetical protein
MFYHVEQPTQTVMAEAKRLTSLAIDHRGRLQAILTVGAVSYMGVVWQLFHSETAKKRISTVRDQ